MPDRRPALRAPIARRLASTPRGGIDPARRLVLRLGSIRDYDALGAFHYRPGRPATFVRVLVLGDRHEARPAAVLVVSMPTLDGRWRELAWPARYRGRDRRRAAHRLNREVRTISRVVVDPRWRGLGVARRLVRAYLRNPMTIRTEAIAAMGPFCPFFAQAGMRAIPLPVRAADARLARALARAGVRPEALALGLAPPTLGPAIRAWARAQKGIRDTALGPEALARAAAASLLARPVAYTHEVARGRS